MQVCTSFQTDNHATTQFFTGRMPFLPPNQQCQSIEGKHHSYTMLNNLRSAVVKHFLDWNFTAFTLPVDVFL